MRKTALMLVAFSCLTISAFAGNKRDADVRKVTIYPLTHYFSYEAIPHTSVVDSIEASHSEFFSMTVTVSDDPGKTYSIDCFAYRVWDHCRLPAATSYSAEIKSNAVSIIAVENNKKHTTYKVKYRITFIQPDTTPRP